MREVIDMDIVNQRRNCPLLSARSAPSWLNPSQSTLDPSQTRLHQTKKESRQDV